MLNYIRADYKRILTRVPRVIFLILFEIVFPLFQQQFPDCRFFYA